MTIGVVVFILVVAVLAPVYGVDTRTPELLGRH